MKVLCVLAGSWKIIDHLDPLESLFQPLLGLALFSLFLLRMWCFWDLDRKPGVFTKSLWFGEPWSPMTVFPAAKSCLLKSLQRSLGSQMLLSFVCLRSYLAQLWSQTTAWEEFIAGWECGSFCTLRVPPLRDFLPQFQPLSQAPTSDFLSLQLSQTSFLRGLITLQQAELTRKCLQRKT